MTKMPDLNFSPSLDHLQTNHGTLPKESAQPVASRTVHHIPPPNLVPHGSSATAQKRRGPFPSGPIVTFRWPVNRPGTTLSLLLPLLPSLSRHEHFCVEQLNIVSREVNERLRVSACHYLTLSMDVLSRQSAHSPAQRRRDKIPAARSSPRSLTALLSGKSFSSSSRATFKLHIVYAWRWRVWQAASEQLNKFSFSWYELVVRNRGSHDLARFLGALGIV
ncbi:hypothetical protein QBC46DRAFT_513 [Diplogelasinospora grovesii]|uniref:Uncharacterized protein n=1 Tax=Diplogelasinospora grovesii TaxID=303347 RepID=A0AAN6NJR9_9PEZI|nr:hypothetical protein QBC46DRAFT_513 [Diplogelasinospora grovesii]